MQDFIGYPSLLKASWQGAVLILLVLAVQWAFGRRLNPRWRYGLWLLVLIRLALPWTIPSPMSVFNLLTFPRVTTSPGGVRVSSSGPSPATAPSTAAVHTKQPDKPSALPFTAVAPRLGLNLTWLLWLWVTGASALAVYLLATHRRLSKKVATFRPLINASVMNLLEECKQQMGVRVPITLVETTAVGSPALFGFIRPRLLLPAGLTQSFSLDELRYVFLHELSHIKRHDILVGWLMTGLQILHWFNPLVWLAFYRMRVDRELACDALALSYAREDENQPYGRTIIKLLESFGRSAWAPSLARTVENKNQMKERITMIAKFEKRNRGLALAIVLFATLGLITLTDAQPATTQLGKDLIGTWICVGTPGEFGEAPAAGGRLKVVTDNKWSLTQTDAKTGATNFHHGGTWALKGDKYAETVEYAHANTASLLNRTFNFNVKVEGDTLTLIGIGNPWKEVWKRVKSEAIKPLKSDSIPQGKWVGSEIGGKAQKDDSKVNEEVKLRMIVLNKPDSGDAAPVRKLAEEIAGKIKEGAAFSEMARTYSQGRNQGGDWGWIKPSVLRKELAEAAISLKSGESSGIIETPEAIYLMLVEDKRPAHINATGKASLVLKGSSLEVHGEDPGEWYKGTFSVYDTTPKQLVILITDCPMPQYVGKTAYAIYKLENGTLTVTGNEPGNPTVPAGFDASGARKLVFKQE